MREHPKRLLPIVLSQAVGFACGVAGIKITSHLISPAVYGAYGVFLTLVPLGIWVVHAGLIKFVGRHWADSPDRRGLLREVTLSVVRKLPLLAVAALAAVWIAPGLRTAGSGANAWSWLITWALLFVSASLLTASQIVQTALQAAREHWKDFGVSATGSITRSFVPPLLYVALGGLAVTTLQVGFVIHLAVLALAAAWAMWACLRKVSAAAGAARQLTPVYDGALFVVLAIAAWALTAVNRWIVAGFFGSEAAGFFTLAGNISIIVTSMLGVVFVQYWQPVFFAMSHHSAEDRRALAARVDRVAIAYALLALAGVGALHFVAPWLVGVLIDGKYVGALAMVGPAGCFGIAVACGQFFHIMLLAARREKACLSADLSCACALVLGGVAAAALGGEMWFFRWLIVSPLVPWLVQRTLARRALGR